MTAVYDGMVGAGASTEDTTKQVAVPGGKSRLARKREEELARAAEATRVLQQQMLLKTLVCTDSL